MQQDSPHYTLRGNLAGVHLDGYAVDGANKKQLRSMFNSGRQPQSLPSLHGPSMPSVGGNVGRDLAPMYLPMLDQRPTTSQGYGSMSNVDGGAALMPRPKTTHDAPGGLGGGFGGGFRPGPIMSGGGGGCCGGGGGGLSRPTTADTDDESMSIDSTGFEWGREAVAVDVDRDDDPNPNPNTNNTNNSSISNNNNGSAEGSPRDGASPPPPLAPGRWGGLSL